MSESWVRLWSGMTADPKWQTIARKSGQPRHLVISLFIHMMLEANEADERGDISAMSTEDAASTMDCDEEQISAILQAMQGRVIDANGRLSGWDRRQPIREDSGNEKTGASSSTERVRAFRERRRFSAHSDEPDTRTVNDDTHMAGLTSATQSEADRHRHRLEGLQSATQNEADSRHHHRSEFETSGHVFHHDETRSNAENSFETEVKRSETQCNAMKRSETQCNAPEAEAEAEAERGKEGRARRRATTTPKSPQRSASVSEDRNQDGIGIASIQQGQQCLKNALKPPLHASNDAEQGGSSHEVEKTAVAPVFKKPKSPQRPDSVSETVWQDFQAIRKAKRAPLTDTALAGMEREAAIAGLSLEDAIRFCCEAGWQAFNSGWYAERQAKLPQKIIPLPAANLNRQEALEARNRAVAAEWVADMEAQEQAERSMA